MSESVRIPSQIAEFQGSHFLSLLSYRYIACATVEKTKISMWALAFTF